MRSGILILNLFAIAWCGLGLFGAGLPGMALLVPVAISGALILWARRVPAPPRSAADGARIGRLVGIWSALEGGAIFVAVTICQNIGAPDAVVPALAIIVGLHFLPLARGIPVRLYYVTGLALVSVGAAALLLPGPDRLAPVGFAAAAILWASCAALIGRASRSWPA